MESSALAILVISFLLPIAIALISFIVQQRISRPKLTSDGQSRGQHNVAEKRFYLTSISIENRPSFLGIKLNRGPAKITQASLYDPASGRIVGRRLMWGKRGSTELQREVTIDAGEQEKLYIFAREMDSDEYFAYSSRDLESQYEKPIARFREQRKDFSVHLQDRIGHRYRFDFTAIDTGQSIRIELHLTFGARCEMIREGLSLLLRAVSSR